MLNDRCRVAVPQYAVGRQELYRRFPQQSDLLCKRQDKDGNIVRELPVKSLVDTLRAEAELSVTTIVFDGIISQRIVEVASEKNIQTVVGVKKGNITKMPAGITLWTKEDLN